jgi:hypothetical protein
MYFIYKYIIINATTTTINACKKNYLTLVTGAGVRTKIRLTIACLNLLDIETEKD